MARVAVPVTQITRAGTPNVASPVTGDTVNGHSVANDGDMFLEVKNTNGGSTARVVTINVQETVDGQVPAARTVSIAAGVTEKIGPFPTSEYGISLQVQVAHAELVLAAYHL